MKPQIYSRDQHSISRAQISDNALKVLYRLKDHGFRACLVGGGVRDILLGREPKDFDIATDAEPEDVRRLFRSARLIGRRFRLAHVHFGREVIEVATFRAPHDEADNDSQAAVENGRIVRDNVYGTLEQDVWRRDFTVNALYYDIDGFTVIDFVGGMEDLEKGVMRLIGDPEVRLREDPVRMLRAVRLASKLGFQIDEDCQQVMHEIHRQLTEAAPARLFEEVLKLFHAGVAGETYAMLRHYHLFEHLFPATEKLLAGENGEYIGRFISLALQNTDHRIQTGQPVTPAFLVAVLLWGVMQEREQVFVAEGMHPGQAIMQAGQEVIWEQGRHVSIPKRFSVVARDIWSLQGRFLQRNGKRPLRLLDHPRFRAAYDFFCLRARAGDESLQEACEWWTQFQHADSEEKKMMLPSAAQQKRRRPRRVRRSRG